MTSTRAALVTLWRVLGAEPVDARTVCPHCGTTTSPSSAGHPSLCLNCTHADLRHAAAQRKLPWKETDAYRSMLNQIQTETKKEPPTIP